MYFCTSHYSKVSGARVSRTSGDNLVILCGNGTNIVLGYDEARELVNKINAAMSQPRLQSMDEIFREEEAKAEVASA